jgi:predicted PurR-regulated permease PerM
MASIGPPLYVPEGRANRRFFATAALVVVAVVLGVIALLLGLWIVRETIVWLVAAGFLAFSIEPLIRMFTRRGVGRGAATALAFTLIAVVILIFSFAIIPSVVDGAKSLKEHIPTYVDQLQNTGTSDALNADQAIESTGNSVAQSSSFFDGSGRVLDFVGGLVHSGFAAFMINKGYWYGKFLIGLIAGLTTFVTMKLLGLPYAAPLSLFVGITDLIPNIGATLGTIPVVIVGLLEEPWKGVVAGVVLLLYQQVENNLITPKVFKETVEIHPFVSVVAVIVFTSLFGIVGALIAVPVTKSIEILYAAVREGRRTAVLEPPLPAPETGE